MIVIVEDMLFGLWELKRLQMQITSGLYLCTKEPIIN